MTDTNRSRNVPLKEPGGTRVLVLMRCTLDAQLFTFAMERCPTLVVVGHSTDLAEADAACSQFKPDVVLLDGCFPIDATSGFIKALLDNHSAMRVLLLDRYMRYMRVDEVLHQDRVGYFTRESPLSELVHAIENLAHGERTFEQSILDRIDVTEKGIQLLAAEGEPNWAEVSKCELDVLRNVALGYSVKEIATILNRDKSTVDNQKNTLMGKLKVNKATKLTLLAIRNGLIDP